MNTNKTYVAFDAQGVYLLKGVACSRIAFYVDVHIAFFYLL